MPEQPGPPRDDAGPERPAVGLVNEDHGSFVLLVGGETTLLPHPRSLLPETPSFLDGDDLLVAAALGADGRGALSALCLTALPPFALGALLPALPLLALAPEAHLVESCGTIATTMALPAGNLLALTLRPRDHHSLTWAGFRKVFAPGTPDAAVWRLVHHNLHEPLIVNRHFPRSGDAAHLARLLRQVFRREVNPELLDPFYFPGEIADRNEAAWRGARNPVIEARIAAAATALTAAAARGLVTVTAATSPAALPVAHVSIEPCDRPLRQTIELEEELGLILEWLLAAWQPAGLEVGIDPAFENWVGMTRSEFRELAIHVEIPIEPTSAHDLMAAVSATSELVAEIATSRPWTNDPHFGRRTGLAASDVPAVLARLEARLG